MSKSKLRVVLFVLCILIFGLNIYAAEPAGDDSSITINEDETYVFITGDFSNYSDPDGNALTSIRIASDVLLGSLTNGESPIIVGNTYNIGDLSYTPVLNANGDNYASFTYYLVDSEGEVSLSPNTMTINVTSVNDAPVITGTISLSTSEDTPLTITIDDVTYTDDNYEGSATYSLIIQDGTNYTHEGNTITPTANFNGTLSVGAVVSDGLLSSAPSTITVTVSSVNDAPVITGTSILSTSEDTPLTITIDDVTYTDDNYEGSATYSLIIQDGTNYTHEGNTITPIANFNGTLSVGAVVSDGLLSSAPSTITVTVSSVNDAPVITGTSILSTSEDTPLTITLDDVTYTDDNYEGSATYSLIIQEGTNYTHEGNTITPTANFNGTLNVGAVVSDGLLSSAPSTITVTVSSVNDAPVITGTSSLSTSEDTPLTITIDDVTYTDDNYEGSVTYSLIIQDGTNYTHEGNTITPTANFNGTLSVGAVVSDGLLSSAPSTITVTVSSVNDAPVITGTSSLSTSENTPLTITIDDVTYTDDNYEGSATYSLIIQDGTNYTHVGNTITPIANFNGTLSVGAVVSDGLLSSAPSTITVTVSSVNDAPVITGTSSLSTSEDTPLTITIDDVTYTDDNYEGSATYSLIIQDGTNYTHEGNTITPTANFNGTLSVGAVVSDGLLSSAPSTITVTVSSVNDAPVITGTSSLSTSEDTPLTITIDDVTYTDDNYEGSATYSLIIQDGTNYTHVGNTITPTANFNGTLNVGAVVSDGLLSSAPSTITVTVSSVNDAPVITGTSSLSTSEDTPLTITIDDVTYTDDNYEGSATYSLIIQEGTNYTHEGNTITPTANFNGTLNVGAVVSDGLLSSAPSTITVTVSSVNDAPVITGTSSLSTSEDTPLTITIDDVTYTDDNYEGSATYSLIIQEGTNYTHEGNTITPTANFNGTLSVGAVVSDGLLSSAPSTITVTVSSVNDAPVITGTSILSTSEDTPLTITIDDVTYTDDNYEGSATYSLIIQDGTNYTHEGNTITPIANFNGTLSVGAVVSDGLLSSAPSTITVTVSSVNDAPVITGTSILSTSEDTPLTITLDDVTYTDDNYEGSATYSLIIQDGTNYTHEGNTITPTANFNGTLSVGAVVSDGLLSSAPSTITVTVSSVNDAPVITGTSLLSTSEDTPLTITIDDVTYTDDNYEGSATYSLIIQDGTNYTHEGNTITPTANFNGTLSVGAVVSDGLLSSAPSTITVTVSSVNDAPVITGTSILSTSEDTPLTITIDDVTYTDDNYEGSATYSLIIQEGTNYTHEGNTITPIANFNGTLSVGAVVSDGLLSSAPSTITVTVSSVNDAPVITGTSILSTSEDTPLTITIDDVTYTDDNYEGSATYSLIIQDGTNYTHVGNTITPIANFNGTLSVVAVVSDGLLSSAPSTITVTVSSVNDAPVITGTSSLSTSEDTPLTITIDDVTYTDDNYEGSATYSLIIQDGTNYTHVGNTITPTANFNGTLSVGAVVSDGLLSSAPSTITVTVSSVNDAPVITGTSSLSTSEDTPLTITIDDVTYTDDNYEGSATYSLIIQDGTNYTHEGNTITPIANFNGTLSVVAVVSDGLLSSAPSTITVTVSSVNDAPVITGTSSLSTSEDTPLTITIDDVTYTDDNYEGSATYSLIIQDGTNYTHVGNTITPTANFNGTLSVGAVVSDGLLSSAPSTITVTVSSVNDAPISVEDAISLSEGGSTTSLNGGGSSVLENDNDIDGNTLTAVLKSNVSNGTLTLNSDGTFSYTHDDSETTSDSFSYAANDGTVDGNTVIVTINISAINDNSPVLTVENTIVEENHAGTVLTATSTDGDLGDSKLFSLSGDDYALFTIGETSGVLSFLNSPDYENPTDNGGDNVYDLTILVRDAVGHETSEDITITVTDVNDNSPILSVANTIVEENHTGVVLTATSTDADAGDSETYSISGTDASLFVIDPGSGELIFKNSPDYENPTDNGGNNIYDLNIIVTDAADHTDSESVTITVSAVNDNLPVISVGSTTIYENHTGVVLTATSTDADAGDSKTYSISGTDYAAFDINSTNGELTFKSAPDFENPTDANQNNIYELTVTVTDGADHTDSESITITVQNIEETANFSIDAISPAYVNENEVYTSVTPHITGSPIGDVVYTLGGTDASAFSINPSSGVVSMEVRDYENPADSNGDNVYSIRITATDEDNNFVSASWSVTVLPVNEFTPVINVGNVTLSENHTGTVTVASATDQDDDDTESYSITGTDSELFAMNSSNGILTFINAPDFENPSDNDNNNIYELTVVVTDGAGHSDSELITITISNLNDNTPIANADAITVNEGGTSTTLSGGNDSVLDNDSDADGDALTAVLMSNVSYGTLTLHPNGTFNYTHDGSENHSDSFTYAANDGSSNGNTVSVSISVTPVNDDPVITDIPDQTRAEDVNFGTISLDSYIDDIETSDEDIIWSVNPVPTFFDIVITNRVASITPKDAEWNGVEVITFYATDEGNTSVYDNVRLEVTAVNDEPIITGQNSISIAEETLTEISLSDLIVEDPDNNYPTNYIMTILPGANYIVNGTAITPNENVTGTITVQVYVVDPAGAQSNTYNLQVNVINDNDPPVVIDIPNQTIAEGATFSDINLNLYVSDPDNTNDQISWSYSGNSDLVIAIDETTKIASVEIPNEDWFGQETIRFTASDGTLSNSNDVVLTVTPVNDAPIINSQQSLTYNEDVVFTIPFTALNVTDIDNTYSSQHEMTLLAGSNYTFSGRQVTPLQDFNGTLTIPLYVSDLGPVNQNSITFNLSVTINPVNDAPVIESQINTISTNEDVPVAISLDDISIIDVDNESTDFSLIVHAGENYTFDGTTITPVLNYYGTLSVDVSVSDGESTNSESSIFTVDVLVLAQNDTPIANSQNVTIAENQQITVNINNLISDVEDGIDLSTLKILSDVTNGTTSIDLQNAIITYVPNNGYSGTDSFTYEICDNEGACASGVISILVSNEAPTGVNDIVDVDEDNSISINVTSNDTDPQDNIDASTLTLLSLPTNGEATIQTGGIVVYTPNSNYFGEDTFEYQVCDEDGYCTTANVFITVNAVNDQPVIVSQNSIEIQEEGTYTVTLNNISVSDVDNNYPSDFILSVLSGNNYTVVGNTITPALNFNGELLVNVIVNDQEQNNNISDVYSLVISVIGVNDRPEITDQLTLFTNEDEPLPVTLTDLIVEDPDNNYPNDFVLVVLAGLNYSVSNNVITPVSNYSGFLNVPVYVSDQSEENNRSRIFNLVVEVVSQNDAPVTQNVNYSTSENVSVEIAFADLVTDVDGNIDYSTFENISTPSNGTIQIDRVNFIVTYTPEQGFSGDDEFNFRFSDAEGLVSNISTVYINVNNEAPNAINDNVEVNEDESIVISVLDNDTDPQDNIDISSLIIINNPVNGVLSLNSSTAEITYTPNENYFGTDNFRYRVFDDLGYSDDATVSISILAVNDLPVAVGDEAETNEDESVIIDVLSNDYDIDSESDGFVVTITLQAENGTAEVNASNQIIYTPNADFNGADTFEYQVCDSENGCNNAQVILQVLPQNDAPVAYDDEITSAQDTEVTINVISNDVDIDDNLDITSLSLLSQPTNGVCTVESLTGEITYVPNEGFSGTDSFIYQICDDEGLCSSATVTVNVSLQNVAPVCEDDVIYMVDGETVTFNVLDNDTDINGDEITVLVDESELLGGFLRVQENGVFTYTSIYGEYCIEEYFTYVGCDDSGNCDEATVKFIIGVADSDEDGIADYIEEQNFNTDGDEFPDYRDTDSDNDGILDVIEGGVSETCLQDVKDTDEDGIPDYRDEDSDDDGVLDSEEGAEDCDNDGILNFQDSFDDCAERIDAPDTFSPNGDGVNDYFMIPGVSDYEGNEIFIYNRWGGEVFHMRNYDNKWDGKSSNSAIGSAELPQGLYFYVVKLGGSNGVIKGSVYIKR